MTEMTVDPVNGATDFAFLSGCIQLPVKNIDGKKMLIQHHGGREILEEKRGPLEFKGTDINDYMSDCGCLHGGIAQGNTLLGADSREILHFGGFGNRFDIKLGQLLKTRSPENGIGQLTVLGDEKHIVLFQKLAYRRFDILAVQTFQTTGVFDTLHAGVKLALVGQSLLSSGNIISIDYHLSVVTS